MQSQSLKYQVENKGSHIEVVFEGEFNRNQIDVDIKKILEEFKHINLTKLLIDIVKVDFTGLRSMDRFFLGEEAARLFGTLGPQGRALKVAIIPPHQIYDGFAETVAKNRGALIEFFFEKSKALDWLL